MFSCPLSVANAKQEETFQWLSGEWMRMVILMSALVRLESKLGSVNWKEGRSWGMLLNIHQKKVPQKMQLCQFTSAEDPPPYKRGNKVTLRIQTINRRKKLFFYFSSDASPKFRHQKSATCAPFLIIFAARQNERPSSES